MLAERITEPGAPEPGGDDFAAIKARLGVPTTAAKPLRVVPRPLEVLDDDGLEDYPLVAEGLYTVAFMDAKRIRLYGRAVWSLRFVISDEGAAHGVTLRCFATAPAKGAKLTPSLKIVTLYGVGTERRPPRNLAALPPSQYLAGCQFEARVRQVTKDSRGVPRAEHARYSLIETLTKRTAGTPPCLRDK